MFKYQLEGLKCHPNGRWENMRYAGFLRKAPKSDKEGMTFQPLGYIQPDNDRS